MILSIMQPYFLPYIGYFQLIKYSDKMVIYDDVTYIKGGWISRNKIFSSGKEIYINAGVTNNRSSVKIHDVLMRNDGWRKKLKRQLEYEYGKYKNNDLILPIIFEIIDFECDNISEFNFNALKKVCDLLGIDTKIESTSRHYNNEFLKGKSRVLDICNKEGAEVYVNTSGGRSLYDFETFKCSGIDLRFIKASEEVKGDLGLSIAHLLLKYGLDDTKNMLNCFEIIKET